MNHPLFDALPHDFSVLTLAVNMGFEAVLVRVNDTRGYEEQAYLSMKFPEIPSPLEWTPDVPGGYQIARRWHDDPFQPQSGLALNALAVKPVTEEARRLWQAGLPPDQPECTAG